nr:hypothetical protein [Aliifodinibius salipaludis]
MSAAELPNIPPNIARENNVFCHSPNKFPAASIKLNNNITTKTFFICANLVILIKDNIGNNIHPKAKPE